ncbi:unnamed protein product [marine sediment metagenome]|uniref:Zinc/iron-chelating domain-containing protein n=1 Tax=marine sediment metagenome TaxID=412755 RepID=X1A9X8_9ZZZZ
MGFHCTGCGLCCNNIAKIKRTVHPLVWMQKLVNEFPYGTDENGACMMLVDGQCSVYDDRPLLCNIERTADELDIGMTKKQWFDMNYRGCEILQQGAQ